MDYLQLRKKVIEKEFSGMNDRQFEAVTTVRGPLLVLAGAGSGKTTVLVNRIAYLIKYGNAYLSEKEGFYSQYDLENARLYLENKTEEISGAPFCVDAPKPYEILAITFTNKAAGELKDRIAKKLGDSAQSIWAGTFHSICGKILRYNADRIGYSSHFTIYDTDDQKSVLKQIMKQNNIDDKMLPVKSVLSYISRCKDSLVSPSEALSSVGNDLRAKLMCELYREYQKRLLASDAMDFDDMIVNTVRLLSENPDVLEHYGNKFRYIMVDEYQDTNHAQYKLVSLLSQIHGNLCVVGDDDQSIYRFRGATIENILNFEDENKNAKTIRLEQNYRSTGNILNAANSVISHNRGRKGKTLWTAFGDGDKIKVRSCLDDRTEARFVADEILKLKASGDDFCESAVLYRMNAQSASIENCFARSGIAYKVIGGMRFFERKEIKDILAYLTVVNNSNDDVRLRRIINVPRRGIGDTTVASAIEIAAGLGISLFEVLKNADSYAALSRASLKLKDFCEMIDNLKCKSESESVSEITEDILRVSGYRDFLLSDISPDAPDRLANIEEFVNTVRQFEEENPQAELSDYLEEIALITDIDSLESDENRVVMMTVHSAKGLEFKNVFLVGMEEGIFPGNMSIAGGEAEIEEERRLAYVALTRAKKRLYITHTSSRMMFGSTGRNLPSRFLKEIPSELCEASSEQTGFGMSYSVNSQYSKPKTPSSPAFGNTESGFAGGYRKKPSFMPNYSAPAKKEPTDCYKVGQTVEHSAFGKGIITSISQTATDAMLEINFEKVGIKKIMAGYAKLKIL